MSVTLAGQAVQQHAPPCSGCEPRDCFVAIHIPIDMLDTGLDFAFDNPLDFVRDRFATLNCIFH
jgi:hypothetical protein